MWINSTNTEHTAADGLMLTEEIISNHVTDYHQPSDDYRNQQQLCAGIICLFCLF